MEVGNLAHSHSQPGGMDRTPPGTPKKGGKMLAIRVQMLDDTVTMFQVQAKALGRVLFDQVCNQLNLLESDYFGLEYQEAGGTKVAADLIEEFHHFTNNNSMYWLDLEKPLCRQIGLSLVDTLVKFCVKFYTPDPSQLEEEFTRYLFCLQIKRDLSQGLLQCNINTAALMASYIVQAECGDYVVEDYPDHRYLSSYKFVPNQDQELERRIMENHKKHTGQSPAEADLNLLETARRCELYGIKMHSAKDHEGCPLNLAVAHMGIVVFQNFSKINTFSWAKIRKISFKRKRFLVKLHPEGYGYYKDTVEFFFEGRNECKNFWKKCVENHGFFRCTMVKKVPRQKTRVLSRGSSFRYSGRTQKQVVDFVRENYVKRQTFQRSQSFRHSSSAHSSVANVGTSISAHPLLPLGDNAVAGTPASLSCGSMTLTSSPVHIADIHAGASPSPPLTTSVSPGTSVTSSPQHFYPQETPYRQTDHRLVKVKHPPVHSRHAVSSHSPTDAATAATNHSASHSSNIVAIDSNTVMSSRNSLKSPEFIDFNDVYSNCYTSLRSLGNVVNNKVSDDEAKTDIFSLPSDILKKSSVTKESVGFESKNTIPLFPGDDVDVDTYTWHRSASCKELYKKETNVASQSNKEIVVMKASEPSYELNIATPIKNYDAKIRKCHSAVTSKNPSVDRTGNLGNEMRIFSSSYPGTMGSLSTESAEGELDDQIVEVLDLKYDSQEEIALSHDDVSHDSYELLEKELDDYTGDSSRNKRSRIVGDNERTRSCSWGSDRGISPLDFRSSEIMGSGLDIRKEQNFWSLEREKILKHKSEIDFRSFSHKNLMGCRSAGYKFEADNYSGAERKDWTPELLNCDSVIGKRSRELDGEMFESDKRLSQWEKRIVCSKGFRGKELGKSFCQEIKLRRVSREEKENFEGLEKKRYQSRRKSFEELGVERIGSQEFGKEWQVRDERRRMEKRREKKEREERFHEGLKEKEQKEREKEKRQTDRRKNVEEKEFLGEKEPIRKVMPKSSDYTNFQEIHFKKFDRVVSNQFGKYPEFLTPEKTYEFLAQEKKVMENYEKVCQVSRLAKELKMNDMISTSGNTLPEKSRENSQAMNMQESNDFGESNEFQVWKNTVIELTGSPKVGRAHVERTKSDPYNAIKNQKRNLLIHQKSIDLTPQHSEEITSDYDNDNGLKKASRSEHDIPYILHKRHCMNGTAKNADAAVFKVDFKTTFGSKNSNVVSDHETRSSKPGTESKKPFPEDISKNTSAGELARYKQKPSSAKVAEAKKAGVQIINLDLKNGKAVSISESKKVGKFPRPLAAKTMISETKPTSPKTSVKKEMKKNELPGLAKVKRGDASAEKGAKISDESCAKNKKNQEPIYSEVFTENTAFGEDSIFSQKNIPPDPPKRTSSFLHKSGPEEKSTVKLEKKTEKFSPSQKSRVAEKEESPAKMTFVQKASLLKPLEEEEEKTSALKFQDLKAADILKGLDEARTVEAAKIQPEVTRVKQDASFSNSTHQRREESLTLFARTRLGLSEGSAFAPVARQGRMGSPFSQRRAKSLDAPYVSVHSLPPADAFSSKDDTVDGNENDIVDSALAKFEEFCKGETKKYWHVKNGDGESVFEPPGNTESEVDSVFTDDLEMENNFKKAVENQSKIDIPFLEEKVLDGVRGRRLLSKIESIDFIDSEGDLDSSKMAEPSSIPSDRLVNLPESIRFPSVRQISGQTSEESADGWDQKEVKVKRRTPRKSIGREEQDNRSNESVVWDSKDDELPEDDVWDENLPPVGKYEGAVVNVGLPAEYLKRGSCGQSIDDDNLSTPMKESSPEHWVSVDDLPEAIEREEKLLKQQEKILREKILNEKLKRELNLDTIDINDRYYDYKNSLKKPGYEEEPLSFKENIKGHSLDTYELNEKKSRERGGNKNSSLDEGLLPNKLINSSGDVGSEEKIFFKSSAYRKKLDYIQCKVVKDVAEIDQFGDNDEELEEFFVVLDDNLGKDGRSTIWDEDDTFGRTPSNDESLISVPDEFKDVEKDDDGFWDGEKVTVEGDLGGEVEIRVNEGGGNGSMKNEKSIFTRLIIPGKLCSLKNPENGESLTEESKLRGSEGETLEDFKLEAIGDSGRLPTFGVSRRDSEENRRLLSDDTGCLSPYDNSSRRSSDDPRRLSASEDAGHLSPFEDSRRGSEDLRRLSASEDSRKCSVSESVSEDTRRRLSSTEETRRKRASLTKQCSIGAESLSDEVITGIQECSSSFEHDEKDVFEPETGIVAVNAVGVESSAFEIKNYGNTLRENFKEQTVQGSEMPLVEHLEIEICEEKSTAKEILDRRKKTDPENASEIDSAIHLAPPPGERELSRETEDSVDYGEGDFKDIRDVVKEKDICDDESIQSSVQKDRNLFEKSECLESEDLLYIDDKRGSTPEILLGRSKEAVAVSIVIVNEGISVLNKINEKDRKSDGILRTQSLPRKPTTAAMKKGICSEEQRHTLPKTISKPKPLTPKPVDYVHRKMTKSVHEIKRAALSPVSPAIPNKDSINLLKSNLDSSQESDLDKLSDLSLISHVQYQIARRNLFEAGKCLKSDELGIFVSEDSSDKKTSSEDDAFLMDRKTSSEEKEKTENSSFELKSSADELVVTDDVKWREAKEEKRTSVPSDFESSKAKKKVGRAVGKEKRSPEQEKRDSGEDGSSSSSGPLCPKRELSSTWKPFLLESSGSSSLEEGWLPPDENAHLADEEETSSTSNNQQDDSCHDDVDYPTGIGFPVLNVSSAEMMVGGYGSVFALSRTLSRISERSTSEQERSDLEDDITKPSSHSVSAEEESIMSSDHQPSLSSDPPSPRESASIIPDLPEDNALVRQVFETTRNQGMILCEPFGDEIPPPLPEQDWPLPFSFDVVDTPVVSHVETVYMEINPEQACKVVVTERHGEGNSSSDENQTFQEESEFLHLSSDNVSASTTTTTQDGTVVIPVRPITGRTSSLSEDASMVSISEWSSSTSGKLRPSPTLDPNEDASERSKGSVWQDLQTSRGLDPGQSEMSNRSTPSKYCKESYFDQDVQKPKIPSKIKPLKLSSPTGKTFGFFETPVSKVRSPTSQIKFFDAGGKRASGYSALQSPTSFSETTSPKNYGHFFESFGSQILVKSEAHDLTNTRSPTKGKCSQRCVCTPYYSNVADSAEKSYFGRYDTGSLERTKIHSSRKCSSYYSVSKITPNEGNSSNSEERHAPSPNTIPRASKKKRRHRVAMDLVVRNGKIVVPPKTKTTVVENSDSDRSSPKECLCENTRKRNFEN